MVYDHLVVCRTGRDAAHDQFGGKESEEYMPPDFCHEMWRALTRKGSVELDLLSTVDSALQSMAGPQVHRIRREAASDERMICVGLSQPVPIAIGRDPISPITR
ncbi:hypothetical protein AYJ54_38300 [Bradyrhizobium centrolobii]|uniref:Uncharacterized protein n=1 Tax=Bradyrhizobium centrolobii TaxID=1505087 RepID=A0A176Z6S3_9BRAD|nr:hypothetical protein AYJ54_38300 [Bradyrhizobium centrolobii]